MELSEIVLNGNRQAWVRWKGDVHVLLQYISPADDRKIRAKAMKPQWVAHQRTEDQLDDLAVRDYYCDNVVKGIRGLTKDGQPFEPTPDDLKAIWEGNHEFGQFVILASRKIENFIAEQKKTN